MIQVNPVRVVVGTVWPTNFLGMGSFTFSTVRDCAVQMCQNVAC